MKKAKKKERMVVIITKTKEKNGVLTTRDIVGDDLWDDLKELVLDDIRHSL